MAEERERAKAEEAEPLKLPEENIVDEKDRGPIGEPGSGGKLKDPRGPGNLGRA